MNLNQGQEYIVRRAVDWFWNSNEQVFQYDGPPGSGKSTVLIEIIRRLGLNIFTEIAPMSFIGAASLVMRTKGLLTAKTAHSWVMQPYETLKRDDNGEIVYKDANKTDPILVRRFAPKEKLSDTIRLIIVDEAYCMPRSMRPIIEKFGIKVLACGDTNQLPPVKEPPAYLIDGNVYHLTEIMRQGEHKEIPWIANKAMAGEPILSGRYNNSLVIDRDQLTDQMLLWADVIICGTNRTRDMLNDYIRYLKGFSGILPNYGERVVCRNNNWDIFSYDIYGNEVNLVNGLIGTVTNMPSVDSFDNKDRTIALNFRSDLVNCDFECKANYNYLIADHKIRTAIKESVYERGQMFEFAYCITCHIAQGGQFHKVIYIEEPMGPITPRLNLVGATRADQSLIYVKNNYGQFNFNLPIEYESISKARQKLIKEYDRKINPIFYQNRR